MSYELEEALINVYKAFHADKCKEAAESLKATKLSIKPYLDRFEDADEWVFNAVALHINRYNAITLKIAEEFKEMEAAINEIAGQYNVRLHFAFSHRANTIKATKLYEDKKRKDKNGLQEKD